MSAPQHPLLREGCDDRPIKPIRLFRQPPPPPPSAFERASERFLLGVLVAMILMFVGQFVRAWLVGAL